MIKHLKESSCQHSVALLSLMRQFLIHVSVALIKVYRFFIAPLLGDRCRFYPSCSHYAEQALKEYGPLKGIFLSVRRLSKCHPWHAGGYDPVPAHKVGECHSIHTSIAAK